ncbi:MAG: NlpC/P60 family protein [Actinomycetota bacterium]
MSRTTKLIAGLLVSLSLWGVGSTAAQAMPMGPAQEAIIRKGAVQAQQAVDTYADKRDRDAYDLYLDLADKLAVDVANFLGVDVEDLQYAWRTADVAHQRAIMAGLTQIGVPYKENATSESIAFDCSGFVQFAWSSAGYVLPHGSNSQYAYSRPVTLKNAQAGDLMWRPGHVSMYLGIDGAILQTARTGRSVELHNMDSRILGWTRFADPTA